MMTEKFLEKARPEEYGISSEGILKFLDRTEKVCVEMHSLMILRHGKLCAQGWWKPYAPEIPHAMFSFSKTLTATAIGFAEQEGILNLEEKLVDIFPEEIPENPCENLKKADIYSLLTMSCGQAEELPWEAGSAKDWIRRFFRLPFPYQPGTMFQYNSTGSNMLSAVLQKKTGQRLTEFLRSRLFEPLGMRDVFCTQTADGIDAGGGGFYLTTEAMARFMQFYLQKGIWNGKRLLQEEWFEKATCKQIGTVNDIFTNHDSNWRHGYGFQIWRCVPEGLYRADGAYGQFGVVVPEKDMVVIITSASTYPDTLLNILWDTVLPAVSDTTLTENPKVWQELDTKLQGLTLPTMWGIRNKASEQMVSGIYKAAQKTSGLLDYISGAGEKSPSCMGAWNAVKLCFEEEKLILSCVQENGETKLYVAMDGTFLRQNIDGREYAATGRWRGPSRFELEARDLETACGARITLDFQENKLCLDKDFTLPIEREEPGDSAASQLVFFKE